MPNQIGTVIVIFGGFSVIAAFLLWGWLEKRRGKETSKKETETS